MSPHHDGSPLPGAPKFKPRIAGCYSANKFAKVVEEKMSGERILVNANGQGEIPHHLRRRSPRLIVAVSAWLALRNIAAGRPGCM